MLKITCEDGGVPANVDLYWEREIENNVINIITMSLQMNVQLTVTQLLFAMTFFRFFFFLEINWFMVNYLLNQNANFLKIICIGYLRTGSQ